METLRSTSEAQQGLAGSCPCRNLWQELRTTTRLDTHITSQLFLQVHAANKPIDRGNGDQVLRRIAELAVGYSGAELANLLNEAAILAVSTPDSGCWDTCVLLVLHLICLPCKVADEDVLASIMTRH
jgi:hypothetical protein